MKSCRGVQLNEDYCIGTLYGYHLYIDLDSRPCKNKTKQLEQASLFMEQAFKNSDFLNDLRDILKERHPLLEKAIE